MRFQTVYAIFFLFGAILITRLFFVQVIDAGEYKKMADIQHYDTTSSDVFERGDIYFKQSDGRLISAAITKQGFKLAINPSVLRDADAAYKNLSEIIPFLDKEDFTARAAKKNDPYEEIIHFLAPDAAEKIKNLEIEGVRVFPENWRYYSGNNLASKILGFVGYANDKLAGRYGLEKYYENALKREGGKPLANSFVEMFSDIKKILIGDSTEGDIVLTIEPNVQIVLEKAISKVLGKYGAASAGGVIIEPSTGKILAMSAKPDFDPNHYGEVKDFSLFSNSLVESVFEPGSIMKPLTLAAALDQGKITAETTYKDDGFLVIDGKRVENYDGKARGVVPMQEILNQSLNTGAVFVMQELGKNEFKRYLTEYGLGEKTGVDLPGEIRSMIFNVLESPRDIEYATASYGQGIAVTPIAMTMALATLANKGILMKPYIVDKIIVKNGADIKTEPRTVRTVLKKETAEQMSRMLVEVVDTALLGGQYKSEHYTVAAKTGTAQYMEEGKRGYVEGEYIHTFFGYAPAFDARFLTLLFLIKPREVRYASHSLTEPFMEITKFLLNYYQVPPDR